MDCAVTSEYQLLDCIRANLRPWKCMEAAGSWLRPLASLMNSLVVLGQGAGAPGIIGSVEEGWRGSKHRCVERHGGGVHATHHELSHVSIHSSRQKT